MHIDFSAAGHSVRCCVERMGADCCIAIAGGDEPHVGCAVLAVPRPSLTGAGESATVSVLNCTGHKDDELAAYIARQVAARCSCTVSCTCGVHLTDASAQDIQDVLNLRDAIVCAICAFMEGDNA